MSDRAFALSPELYSYLLSHCSPLDDIARELIATTKEKMGRRSGMQISPDQGAFMTMLAGLIGARRAVEVGTFTGYSALAVARGLPDDGTLLCCDVSDEWTSVGRPYWERAGVAHKIDLRIAPAADTLKALPADIVFDMAFIDADKENYGVYFDEILPRLRTGGVILVDNVLWSGKVIDEAATDADTIAIRAFNDRVASDTRVDVVMLPVGDGLTLIRKR